MSRKRSLKKREDYRGGGYVARKRVQSGGAPEGQVKGAGIMGRNFPGGATQPRALYGVNVAYTGPKPDILTPDEKIEDIDERAPTTDPTPIKPTTVTQTQKDAEAGVKQEDFDAGEYDAEVAGELDPTAAAVGVDPEKAEAKGPEFTEEMKVKTAERIAEDEEKAKAPEVDFEEDTRSQINPQTGVEEQVATTPDAERKFRDAITGEPAPEPNPHS